FDAIYSGERSALESDKDFGASGIVKQIEEFVIVGDGEIRFSEPVDLFFGNGAEELFRVGLVDERVVVGELDKGALPDALDGVNFRDDAIDRLDFVIGRYAHGGGAELTAERAATLDLNGQPVIALDVEEIEAGH